MATKVRPRASLGPSGRPVARRHLLTTAALAAAAGAGMPITAGAGPDLAMRHIVLLGDSIFDNGAYVAGLVTLSTLLGMLSLPFALGVLR